MARPRFMADNRVEVEMVTVSSAALGSVGEAVPVAYGGGLCYAQGLYSGQEALEQFRIEIDSTDAGDGVGEATFAWRGGDATSWEATQVPTSSTPITLRDGVQVRFAGDGFQKADYWLIHAARDRGRAALLDRRPDVYWEAEGCTDESITVDLGTPTQIKCLVLGDHNLSAAAVVTLMADDAADWDTPAYSQAVSVSDRHLCAFLDQTYRYWRVSIQDPTNPDGVIRVGELYLGGFFEPSWGFSKSGGDTREAARQDQSVDGGLVGGQVGSTGRVWNLQFPWLTDADMDAFDDIFGRVNNRASRLLLPLWFCPDSDRPQEVYYVFWDRQQPRARVEAPGRIWSMPISLREHGD